MMLGDDCRGGECCLICMIVDVGGWCFVAIVLLIRIVWRRCCCVFVDGGCLVDIGVLYFIVV